MSTEEIRISLEQSQSIYFASDIHFGEPDHETSRRREDKLLIWLERIRSDAAAIFFVGDIFDFWFEYKHVVPKGFVRFLGKLSALADSGIPVFIFPGNHDMWMNDYLEEEVGARIYRDKLIVTSNDKKIFVAHGDGLGPGDTKFKLLKKVFRNPFCQWLFRWLHPDIGIKIANLWSRRSRQNHALDKFQGPENEWLVKYAERKLETQHLDYFVFGHRHIPIEYQINEKSKYINLGDWIVNNTYGEFDGNQLHLRSFKE